MMTATGILEYIEKARGRGAQVAIELPREGFWIGDDDTFRIEGEYVHWHHDRGQTFLIYPSLIYLRIIEPAVVPA